MADMANIQHLQEYISDSLEVVQFKLIREPGDVDDDCGFPPEMAHQIFGEKEQIFGFKDLQIDIFYSAGPLDIYFNVSYAKKVEEEFPQIKSDPVTDSIEQLFPEGGYFTNLEEFLKVSERSAKTFRPLGDKINEFSVHGRDFGVYLCDMKTPNFLKYHARFESFIMWYIDAASRIIHDSQFVFFVIFEKYKNSAGEERHASVGYASVYQYYVYPDNMRPRVSQVLVLPPFQNLGVGTKMIEAIYQHFLRKQNIADITFEDQSEVLQFVRLSIDCKLCKNLPEFSAANLKKGLTKEMLRAANENFKLNPKQVRVVCEVLRLDVTNKKDKQEYQDYRIFVKKRLNLIFQKQKNDLLRAQKHGANVKTEIAALPSVEERQQTLQTDYEETETLYVRVLERLHKVMAVGK